MADNDPKVSREQYDYETGQRGETIIDLNKKARGHFEAWEKYSRTYPELKDVTTLEGFQRALQRNPNIPHAAWQEYESGVQLMQQARELSHEERAGIADVKRQRRKRHQDGAYHTPPYMDHDERYQRLLDANPTIVKLREQHPALKGISSVSLDTENNTYRLNPELVTEIAKLGVSIDAFTIEEATRERFRTQLEENDKMLLAYYDRQETNRIYKTSSVDPAVIRMERTIAKKRGEALQQHAAELRKKARSQQIGFDGRKIAAGVRLEALQEFARKYPKKAEEYSAHYPELPGILAQIRSEKENPPPQPTEAERKAALQSYYTQEEARTESQRTAPTQAEQEIQRRTEQTRAPVFGAIGATRPMPNPNPAPSNVAPQTQLSGGNASGGAPPPPRQGLPGGGMNRLVPNVSNIAGVVSKLSWLAPPRLYILIGLLILLLIIIFLMILIGAGDEEDNKTTPPKIPVTVDKRVDKDAVPNPPDTEDITYTIDVSYPGTATDIIVEDPIPAGAEYVSSNPQGKTLDGSGKETTDPKQIKKVVWSLWDIQRGNGPDASSSASSTPAPAQGVDPLKYTQSPYNLPPPNGPSDVEYTAEIMANLNTLGNAVARNQAYLTSKYDPKYVDPFLSVIWVGAIEGTWGDPYSWNCQDNPNITINDGCSGGYYSGGWQVGYGIQVSQAATHLEEDFNVAYGDGSAANAEKVREVGQAVITGSASSSKGKITNPASFPKKTIETLVYEASRGDASAQQAIAILLMDPDLGSIIVSLEVAGDISAANNWRGTMESWGSSYYSGNMQNFSNRMRAIAEKYTGEGGGTGGNSFTKQTLQLVVRAVDADTYIINQATAKVVGAGSKRSRPNRGDISCQEPPDYPQNLTKAIGDEFQVYPEGFDAEHQRWIWETLWCFSGTAFPNLTDNTELIAVANVGDSRMECLDSEYCRIYIGQMPGRETTFKFLLTHELGHVIGLSNTREETHWTEFENAHAREQGLSYYGNNAAACTGSTNIAEDYADTIAYFLIPDAGETTPACDPDKNPPNPFYELKQFPLHLEVAKKILL